MKKWFYLFGFALTASLFVGCSDDEDDNEEGELIEDGLDENEVNYQSVSSILLLENVDDAGNVTYTLPYGEVLDASTPSVRTMTAESSYEAYDWFVYHCVPIDQREDYKDLMGEVSIDMKDYGTITFKPSQSSDLYGSVLFNLKSLPSVTRLNFIPVSLWPDNDISPIITRGDLVYDTQGITASECSALKGKKYYYLCVSDCQGNRGLLFCLNQSYGSDCYFSKWGLNFRKYVATEDTWRALANLYVSDKENFAGQITQMAKENPDAFPNGNIPAPLDALAHPDNYNNAIPEAPCGEPVYREWTETWNFKGIKKTTDLAEVTQNVVKVHPNTISYENGIARFQVYKQELRNMNYWTKGYANSNGSFTLTFSNSEQDRTRFLKVDN
jgi:hypothetical protein